MNRLVAEIEADIVDRSLLPDGQTVLVAVSGGVDSIVLLDILRRLSARHRWELVVAHFNHQLRGKQSDGDERFVRSLALQMGLRCVVGRGGVGQQARRRGVSVEMAARDARHAFLAAAAREQGASCAALAHHADDQVELFLLRLLRGASAEGLGGMKWRGKSPADSGIWLVRPLLRRRKEVLLTFARSWSLNYRPDPTNDSRDILRNRIRRDLIPLLRRQYQPGLIEVILRQADLCAAEAEFVSSEARRWLAKRRPSFSQLEVALQRRVLFEQLLQRGIEPEFEKVEALRRRADHPVQIRDGVVIRRLSDGAIERGSIPKAEPSRPADGLPGMRTLKLRGSSGKTRHGPYVIQWSIRVGKPPRMNPGKPAEEWFDADSVGPVVHLRTRQPGDRFQPSGMRQPCKLQDLLTNAGIAREERDRLMVAADAAGVIWWVDGLRIGESFKVRPGTTRFLRWKWSLK